MIACPGFDQSSRDATGIWSPSLRSASPSFGALVALVALAFGALPARAASLEELVASVVRIKTYINPDGQTVQSLGREREGSGIVIDEDGLVLTIGYLMVEAHAAEVVTNAGRTVPATIVGYDHETGFGILRAIQPLKIKPLPFGRSADVKRERSGAGREPRRAAHGRRRARVAAKREFAGSWEYLLDEAIFTAPPHPAWSGAALITREGKLIGVGSLIVGDAAGDGAATPGNMFVPIERLPPILGDLIADGRVAVPAVPGSASRPTSARPAVCRRASRRAVRPRRPASARATRSSGSAAKRRAAWRISTARSGRPARPGPPCRSTWSRAARSGASTCNRSTGWII